MGWSAEARALLIAPLSPSRLLLARRAIHAVYRHDDVMIDPPLLSCLKVFRWSIDGSPEKASNTMIDEAAVA
ncbi:hypothetical protein FE844_013400 [Rhizobium indicum]|uniref:hypothetical protein n=1 Tax=Rhizobium indicum TaxID=2583231 RepID=UPI0011067DC9|nr:hypothetical protein [Rhizobium indicum]QKK30508.1 hypothetical protein FE844_013400 [Rhizobium indicum]